MKTRRKLPYGVMNYEELARECYFVDNTGYIRELEGVKTPVFLRPKRFGKSVWCSVFAAGASRLEPRRRNGGRRSLRRHRLQVVPGVSGLQDFSKQEVRNAKDR